VGRVEIKWRRGRFAGAFMPRYRLAREATFRLTPENQVVCFLNSGVFSIALDLYRVLLEFAQPATPRTVLRRTQVGMTAKEFDAVLAPLRENGLLVAESTTETATKKEVTTPSLFNERIWGDPELRVALAEHLQAGHPCIIQNAMDAQFAEEVANALEAVGEDEWQVDEFASDAFNYRQHALMHRSQFPHSLHRFEEFLDSPQTKSRMSKLTGTDCASATDVWATLYAPGDFASPHNDNPTARAVSFVWHLTRTWKPAWGGAFYWCETGNRLFPAFNTLVLFKVSARTEHLVCTTSPLAERKRLAVRGWWRTNAAPSTAKVATPSAGWYDGPPLAQLSEDVFAIVPQPPVGARLP
jgi:Rps23 Pro-64 3,4-dihydroxylase Tpa1-like proline 4-hydroxylase